MKIDNLDQGELDDILNRLSALEKARPVGSTAVSSGALRILSPEGFYVGGAASAFIDGLLKVLGTLQVTGDFNLSGDTDASGAWTQSGSFTLTGPFTLQGDTTMTGNLSATGTVTLNGPVTINGALGLVGDVTITGNVTATGAFIFNGPITLNGDLTLGTGKIVFGSAFIDSSGGITAATNLILTAGTAVSVLSHFAVQDDSLLHGNLAVDGTTQLSDDVHALAQLRVDGDASLRARVYLVGLNTTTHVPTGQLYVDPSSSELLVGS